MTFFTAILRVTLSRQAIGFDESEQAFANFFNEFSNSAAIHFMGKTIGKQDGNGY